MRIADPNIANALLKSLPHKKEMASFSKKKGHFENWLPLLDALRNQFAGPSKGIIDIILVAQNQVKDGFWLSSSSKVWEL